MNQFVDYRPLYATSRISTGVQRDSKPKLQADFNPYMKGFNNYYNDNKKLVSVMDQYYQDFNIINNTCNGYSSAKPSPIERKYSAIQSKDFRKKYNVFMKRTNSGAETKATEVCQLLINFIDKEVCYSQGKTQQWLCQHHSS